MYSKIYLFLQVIESRSYKDEVFCQVDIWEERRVFGSRGSSLREELLFKAPLSPVHDNVTVEREKPPASPPKVVSLSTRYLLACLHSVVGCSHLSSTAL